MINKHNFIRSKFHPKVVLLTPSFRRSTNTLNYKKTRIGIDKNSTNRNGQNIFTQIKLQITKNKSPYTRLYLLNTKFKKRVIKSTLIIIKYLTGSFNFKMCIILLVRIKNKS